MDVDQALAILDRALQSVQGNRADHVAIAQAFGVVSEAVKPPAEVSVED